MAAAPAEPPSRYVPAAGRAGLTALYDPVMALTMREQRWRPRLVAATLAGLPRGGTVIDVGAGTGALLVGLLGNALFGAWWLDPIVGLLIAAVAVREGLEAWRGEGCCACDALADALAGPDGDGCRDDVATPRRARCGTAPRAPRDGS